MSDWSNVRTIWFWLQSQIVDYNGIIDATVYDQLLLYDRAIGHKRYTRTKTNFSRIK